MHHGKDCCEPGHGMMMGHGHGHGHGDSCCHGARHFLTREEKIEHLEMYKEWLEKEAQGVKEAIDELKKA